MSGPDDLDREMTGCWLLGLHGSTRRGKIKQEGSDRIGSTWWLSRCKGEFTSHIVSTSQC
ncbi:hypothetical protein VDGL01_04559 [Verticillium dahliae]